MPLNEGSKRESVATFYTLNEVTFDACGYVYLGSGNTVQVVDPSRPEAPVEVGSFVSPGGSPRKLAQVGDML